MTSRKQEFQTAVNKSTDRAEREQAIDALIIAGECERLAILVQMSGLDGPFRRRALNGLAQADCTDLLRTLIESGELEGALQSSAEAHLRK